MSGQTFNFSNIDDEKRNFEILGNKTKNSNLGSKKWLKCL